MTETATETTQLTPPEETKSTCYEKTRNCCTGWLRSPKMKVCITAAFWGFMTGVERAIILPTLWLYFFKVFSQDAAVTYYGVTLAAFNCGILIISPFFGFLAYKGIRIKLLLVIANQLEIVGNILYVVADQPWLVLVGRFIAGLGGGSEVPLYADITRLTTVEERTPYIATLLLARQFGLIIGPACTLFMAHLHLKIGKVSIDVYNGPGLVMAILWAAHTILTLAIYPRVNKDGRVSEMSDADNFDILDHFYRSPNVETAGKATELISSDEHPVASKADIGTNNDIDETKQILSSEESKKSKACSSLCNYERFQTYTKYETIVTLIALFGAYFSLMGLEAVLPPVATRYFKWSEVQISYVYLSCGILVIFVYLVVRFVSKVVQDRTTLIIGCSFLILSYTWIMIVTAVMDENHVIMYISLICTGIFFHVVGQPFMVCSESLYTKTLPIEDMDIGQTILRTVLNIAFLVGPFVGGSMVHIPSVVFAIMLVLIIIPTVLILSKFDRFTHKY